MRVGIFFPSVEHEPLDAMAEQFQGLADDGFASGWLPQSRSYDALTALAVIGRQVEGIELGTAVVPTFPRHPIVLATQALTANAATGGRLRLGIGLSHKAAIEGSFGLSYDKPARHMAEYLDILMPVLNGGSVDVTGETLSGHAQVVVPGATACPVYLAALQPRMLHLAGRVADGTITWCTGPVTLEKQIVPLISEAAREAGRAAPRVVVALPCCVTDDEADGRAKADRQLEGYGRIPVYRAVLDAEGAKDPGDVSVVGNESQVAAQIRRLESIGATDFVAILCGDPADRARTRRHLATVAG